MADIADLLHKLWDDYAALNPQAHRIHALLEDRGETVVNDHIALRTFDAKEVSIDVLSRVFTDAGYRPVGEYQFKKKKLHAQHFEHPHEDLPRVFISELKLSECSDTLQRIVGSLIEQVDQVTIPHRPWDISFADYQTLGEESEYAAWVSAFGFRVNHFTVLVNALKTFDSLESLNTFLKNQGFELNRSGGEIKGSAKVFLEQSSTLADHAEVDFAGTKHTIPCCYYEFARRYPDASGKLFSGFVAGSADKIFESTDRRPPPEV